MNTFGRASLMVPLCLLLCAFAVRAQEAEELEEKPAPKPAPKAAVKPSSTEAELMELVNKERVARGLSPLKVNNELLRPARSSSNVLARGTGTGRSDIRVVEGEESTEITPAAAEDVRVTRTVAWTEGVYPLDGVVDAWLRKKECRDRLLDPNLKEGAIGIARTSRNEFYYTLMLAGPGKP